MLCVRAGAVRGGRRWAGRGGGGPGGGRGGGGRAGGLGAGCLLLDGLDDLEEAGELRAEHLVAAVLAWEEEEHLGTVHCG